MIGIRLAQAKSSFFDKPAVMSAVDKATRKVLSKFGAFVRTRSRSSIRRRKKTSAPGQPPSSHLGLLKDNIFFVFDKSRQSVVIGPILLNQKTHSTPEALEYGGPSQVFQGRRERKKLRTVEIRPRPFMGPAFEQEQQKLPALWRDSIRK